MAGTTGLVQGKNCIFLVNMGDGYKVVVCAKGFGFTADTELKETTSRGSGVHKEFDYKSITARMNLTGLIKVVDADGDPVFFDLAFYQKNFLEVPFLAKFTDNAGNQKQIRGLGIIASTSFNASAAQLADATADIQITGEYFIEDDFGFGCANSIIEVIINSITLSDGDNLGIANSADLELTIVSLNNPAATVSRYDYEIDSSGRNSAFSSGVLPFDIGTIEMGGYTSGPHTLKIIPVCDNGFDGSTFTINITKSSPI